MKYKTRIKAKHYADGNALVGNVTVEQKYVVEIKLGSGWMPVGDGKDIKRYDSKEAAQEAADRLAAKELNLR